MVDNSEAHMIGITGPDWLCKERIREEEVELFYILANLFRLKDSYIM